MPTANALYPPARLPSVSARLILTLFAVLAVILACGGTVRFLTAAPARELQLAIQIDNALVAGDAPVQITVRVSDLSRGGLVALSGGQRLTCGGVSDPADEAFQSDWNFARFLVPRQPPGGAYTCVYTDESGLQTTATIPVLLAQLAFTSPTAGAHVRISAPFEPQSVATPPANAPCLSNQVRQLVVIHYTFPVPPGYTPPLPDQPVSPRFADQEPYATVTAQAGIGSFSPPPAQCYEPRGSGLAATGTYVLSFVNAPSGVGFQQIVPGPGYIELSLAMQWLPPAGGFQAIVVDTQDSVAIPIVWTTPH